MADGALDRSEEVMLSTVKLIPKTTVAIIPPKQLWPTLQAFREIHDPVYCRWPPHLNVIYPFVPEEHLETFLPIVQAAARKIVPFETSFEPKPGFFKHSKRSATLWVGPTEKPGWDSLKEAVREALPSDWPERKEFVPHLSVGKFHPKKIPDVQDELHVPTESWKVSHFSVLCRKGYADPFKIVYRVDFGSGEVHKVDEEYLVPDPPGGNPYKKPPKTTT